jgi:cytochrome P450
MNLPISEIRRPPGPDDPLAPGIDAETLALLQELQASYGNVVRMTKPNGRTALFINDADEVRKLLVKHHGKYRKGPGFERVKMLLGNGLIVSDGATWRRSRTMIQPAFTRQNVHRLIGLMVSCCESRVASWEEIASRGGQINITQEMSDFALELIMRSIFGPDYERSIMKDGDNPFSFLSRDSTRDLRVVLKIRELRHLLMSIITERRNADTPEHNDFLSIYLSATDKSGKKFSDDELLDELMTLIVAGYETSAGTLNWAWYLLAHNAGAERELLDEARRLIPDPTRVDVDTITEMAYAQQFLEETLRLYPPVWLFTRRADQDDALINFDVQAGSDIYLSPYILHRTAEYWPEPDNFDPLRFGPDSQYKKGDRPYFPFSLGPRRCLGEYFSFLEMKIHLGLLIQRFRMTLVTDEQPELDLGINLRSQNDIFLRPELRENSLRENSHPAGCAR